MDVDGNGWATGGVTPLAAAEAWALLSPAPEARVDIARWAHQARTFFGASLEIVQHKKYPDDITPDRDAFELDVARRGGAPSRVLIVTVPIEAAPEVMARASDAVRAIGGAGFDALVARARRLWQVAIDERDAPPLAVAAILASVLLAPIVAPDASAIFGVKGARERLAARGW